MMHKRIPCFVIFGLLCLSLQGPTAQAEEAPPAMPSALEALNVYDNFIVALAAAGTCLDAKDPKVVAQQAQFTENFKTIGTVALHAIEREKPDLEEQKVKDLFHNRYLEVSQSTRALVEEKGCESGEVKPLLQAWDAYAAQTILPPSPHAKP